MSRQNIERNARQQFIIDKARQLYSEKGVEETTMEDIAREAELSPGTLYIYFKNKEELLTLIQEQGRAIVARVMEDQLADLDNPAAALEMAVRSHLYLSEVLQPWFFFSYMETRFFHAAEGKRAIAGELQTEAIFVGILERGTARGAFEIVDPLLVAAAIKALLQDWYLKRWKYAKRQTGVDQYADFIVEFVMAYHRTSST